MMIDQTANSSEIWRQGVTSMTSLNEEHLNRMFPIKPSKFMLSQQALRLQKDDDSGKLELPEYFSWLDSRPECHLPPQN